MSTRNISNAAAADVSFYSTNDYTQLHQLQTNIFHLLLYHFLLDSSVIFLCRINLVLFLVVSGDDRERLFMFPLSLPFPCNHSIPPFPFQTLWLFPFHYRGSIPIPPIPLPILQCT